MPPSLLISSIRKSGGSVDDKERLAVLEQSLAQMLKPVRGIPLSVIVKSLAEQQLIQVNKADPADIDILERLEKAIRLCAAELKSNPMKRPRPNEVGNDVEAYVMRALPQAGLTAARPTSKGGLGKATGYPDVLVRDRGKRATYLECKMFAHGSADTTMRSFYLSPSESFKVSVDARPPAFGVGHGGQPDRWIKGLNLRSEIVQTHRPSRSALCCKIRVQFRQPAFVCPFNDAAARRFLTSAATDHRCIPEG